MPAASLAASRRRSIGRGERCSETRSGPPAPWNSDAPRTLSSELDEVRQHVAIAPAGRALRLPGVVVERAPAHVEHRVHRARAAERSCRAGRTASARRRAARARSRSPSRAWCGTGSGSAAGILMFSERSAPPASSSSTRTDGSSDRRLASTQPGRAGADDHVVVHRRILLRSSARRRARAERGGARRARREAVLARVQRLRSAAGTRACSRASWRRCARARRDTTSRSASTRCRRSAPAARGRWPASTSARTSIAPRAARAQLLQRLAQVGGLRLQVDDDRAARGVRVRPVHHEHVRESRARSCRGARARRCAQDSRSSAPSRAGDRASGT